MTMPSPPVRIINRYAPEGIKRILRPAYWAFRSLQRGCIRWLDGLGIINPEDVYDEHYYSRRWDDPWRSDARSVSKALDDHFGPASVLDLGCGIGSHLELFHDNGIDVHGVEVHDKAIEHAIIPTDNIEQHDLRDRYTPSQRYDLAISIEVAEHIPKYAGRNLVRSLCEASETVVMTAAPPKQGGIHHINLQPRSYWIGLFDHHGFAYDADAVASLRSSMEVTHTTWVPDNVMVFRQR